MCVCFLSIVFSPCDRLKKTNKKRMKKKGGGKSLVTFSPSLSFPCFSLSSRMEPGGKGSGLAAPAPVPAQQQQQRMHPFLPPPPAPLGARGGGGGSAAASSSPAPPPLAPSPLPAPVALSVAAPGRAPYVPPRKVLRVDAKGQATYVLVTKERDGERKRERVFPFLRAVDRDSLSFLFFFL